MDKIFETLKYFEKLIPLMPVKDWYPSKWIPGEIWRRSAGRLCESRGWLAPNPPFHVLD